MWEFVLAHVSDYMNLVHVHAHACTWFVCLCSRVGILLCIGVLGWGLTQSMGSVCCGAAAATLQRQVATQANTDPPVHLWLVELHFFSLLAVLFANVPGRCCCRCTHLLLVCRLCFIISSLTYLCSLVCVSRHASVICSFVIVHVMIACAFLFDCICFVFLCCVVGCCVS